MITRSHRFHGYNALRHVYGRGLAIRGPHIQIKYLPNPRRSSYRAAVVVSRKVHKSAVVRNRIRRRVYEILRRYGPDIQGSYDIVITVFHEQVAGMPPDKLEEVVATALRRAKMLAETDGSRPRDIVDAKESV